MDTDHNLYQSIGLMALITGLLLLIPLTAMQFTDEVVWTLSDFILAGTMLFGTGLTYILITRKSGEIIYRIAIGFALFTGLFLIWVNLAVGIVGSEDNPANLLYFAVIATGIIGSLIARFNKQGMATTMFSMAFVQALIAAIVLAGGYYQTPPESVIHILSVNGFFITLFVVSGLLFRYGIQGKTEKEIE